MTMSSPPSFRSLVRSMKQRFEWLGDERFSWICVSCIIVVLFAVEAGCFLPSNSPWRRLAGFSWLTISMLVLVSTWVYSFRPFFERHFWKDPHRLWFILAFFAPICIAYVDITGIFFSIVDGEGIAGMNDAHDQMISDDSFGIYRIAYWRYSSRQYLINYQPTFWFGPSLIALRVGMTMCTLGGVTFFMTALRSYLKSKESPLPTLSAAFAGAVVCLGYFAMTYIRKFDTCNAPLGVMLFFLAALLLYETGQTPWKYLLVFWGFGFFPYSYTPAVAGWVIALVILSYLAYKGRFSLLPVILYGIVAFLVAGYITRDVIPDKFRLGPPDMVLSDWIWRWFQAVTCLGSAKESLIPAPLNLVVFAALYLSLIRRHMAFPFVLCWGLATTLIAFTISGYNFDLPYFHTEKALVILPVYSLGSILVLSKYLSEQRDQKGAQNVAQVFFCSSIIYMIATGVQIPFMEQRFLPYGDDWNFQELLADINKVNFNPALPKPRRIYVVPPLDMDDALFRYFDPAVIVIHTAPPPGEKIPGTYIFSYINPKGERWWDPIVPSRHPRPYVKMEME